MATITEDYVSFEIAKLLKEKGFDEGCSFVVNATSKGVMPVSWPTTNSDIEDEKANLIALPTLQMAMKWLREVHNLHIWVEPNHDKEGLYNAHVKVGWWSNNWAGIGYSTHEKATEAAIKYCLKVLI